MCNNHMPMGKRVRDQIIIGLLEKGADRCRFVTLSRSPGANRAKGGYNPFIRSEKKALPALGSPVGQLIPTCRQFIAHLFNAEHRSGGVSLDQSRPEGGAEIEPVVQVLSLDKNVAVQQVAHQAPTPRLRPSSWKVACFEKPSMRKASV